MKKNITYFLIFSLLLLILISLDIKKIDKSELDKILNKNKELNKNGYKVEDYLPYTNPAVIEPIVNGVDLKAPINDLGNQKLAKIGCIDITAKPFFADPTGKKDSTKAIQKAINTARDRQMVCFFPQGIYKVSDTLECIQNPTLKDNYKIQNLRAHPCILIGSVKDQEKRATIFLSPKSKGFDDPKNPKPVIYYWTRGTFGEASGKGPNYSQPNVSLNNIFKDIDIVIGGENKGAIGINFQGAEGSSIQSIKIDATNGYIGLCGISGSGGSHHDIVIIGGKIGIETRQNSLGNIYYPGTQPVPTMAYVTLINQTDKALCHLSRGPLICVGWKIIYKGDGPVIKTFSNNKDMPFDSSLCMVDCQIEFKNKNNGNLILESERSLIFENVYLKNASTIIREIKVNSEEWIHVKRLAYNIHPKSYKNLQFDETPFIEGEKNKSPFFLYKENVVPPADLCSKHIWDKSFPSFESKDAVNIKEPPYNAKGDGYTDDTNAIQKAINENEIVFIPRGYYYITDTLKLKSNTKLIGLSQAYSTIIVRKLSKNFSNIKDPSPLIETKDDTDADTILAFIGLHIPFMEESNYPYDYPGCYGLKWMCGKNSIYRSVDIHYERITPIKKNQKELKIQFPAILITGNGGGKWYNHYNSNNRPYTENYRHILISNTDNPLSFYQLQTQYASNSRQFEIINAKNFDIFGIKSENFTGIANIQNCSNFRIFGVGGKAFAPIDSAHFIIKNCNDFLISNIGDQIALNESLENKEDWQKYISTIETTLKSYCIIEYLDINKKVIVPSLYRPIFYQRGNPEGCK